MQMYEIHSLLNWFFSKNMFDLLTLHPNHQFPSATIIIPRRANLQQSSSFTSDLQFPIRHHKFLEVPQIARGLNNQKIAFARAALTARFLNRTLLMPRLSSSLFYKEIDLLQPVGFDKIFQFEKFNYVCSAFIRLGKVFDLNNSTEPFELHKGSGRKWTKERDLNQLRGCKDHPIDGHETIRVVGKNPFLWHDHWPVKDYAKIFEYMVFVDEITAEACHVICFHMRIEKD